MHKLSWIPRTRIKGSIAVLAFISACSAIRIFHDIHPWRYAFSLWWMVPWSGLMGYLYGYMDTKIKQTEREIDSLEKEVDKVIKETMLMHMKTKFDFRKDLDN